MAHDLMAERFWACCIALLCAVLLLSDPAQADYAHFDDTQLESDPKARLSLRGDWMFAWDRHLTPQEAINAFAAQTLPGLQVPADWSHAVPEEPSNPHRHGIATYAVAVSLPEDLSSELSLHMGTVHDAYRAIWVPLNAPHDAVEIALEGAISGESLSAVPELNHIFPASGDGLLVLHVNKFMFTWGGISRAPFISRHNIANLDLLWHYLTAGILIGMLLLILLRNAMLFFSELRDVAAGVLAIIALLVLIRVVAVENLAEALFGAQWHALRMRVEIGCVPILASWSLLMFQVLFPRPTHKLLGLPLQVGAHLIGVTAFFVPLETLPTILNIAQLVTLAIFFPAALRALAAIRENNTEARLLGFTAFLCLLAGTNDIYAANADSYTLYLVPVSVVVLVMILSQIIGNRASVAIASANILMEEKEQLARDRNDAVYLSRHDHLTGLL
ncbi:MAG: hypothetical protein GY883_22935, partial [Shimia sp.]|nr:hypothetical protein [Shimia sp.]